MVDALDNTIYLSIIKDIYVKLIFMILVKSLMLMAGDIINSFFTAPCAEIFFACGEFFS